MSLLKSKKSLSAQQTTDDLKKKNQEENGDSCPMCHVSDEIINQLKGRESAKGKN